MVLPLLEEDLEPAVRRWNWLQPFYIQGKDESRKGFTETGRFEGTGFTGCGKRAEFVLKAPKGISPWLKRLRKRASLTTEMADNSLGG
jgi:hypothetical protein